MVFIITVVGSCDVFGWSGKRHVVDPALLQQHNITTHPPRYQFSYGQILLTFDSHYIRTLLYEIPPRNLYRHPLSIYYLQ